MPGPTRHHAPPPAQPSARPPALGRRPTLALSRPGTGPLRVDSPALPPIAQSPRLILRPLRPSDREAFVALLRKSRPQLDQGCALHAPGQTDDQAFDHQLTLAAAEGQQGPGAARALRRVAELRAPLQLPVSDPLRVPCVAGETDNALPGTPAPRETFTLAGMFNLISISRGLSLHADLNWWVATPLTGLGLATEGLNALAELALADLPAGLGLHRLQAWIQRNHLASARVAAKAGFRCVGPDHSYLSVGSRWCLHDLWIRTLQPDATVL